MVTFYDAMYTRDPSKWASDARDNFAYQVLSHTVPKPTSLLDYGCGNGHTIQYLEKLWPETDFYGYDISPVAIGIAGEKSKAKLSTVLDFPKVSIITVMGVAEHFENLNELGNLKRLLAPRGVIYLEIPNCLSYSDIDEEGFRKTHSGSGQTEWHLRRETWEQRIRDQGYEIVESTTGGRPSWEFVWVVRNG